MLQIFVGLFVRHLLTAGGGALVAQGILEASAAEAAVGAATTLLGVAFSIVNKLRAK